MLRGKQVVFLHHPSPPSTSNPIQTISHYLRELEVKLRASRKGYRLKNKEAMK